jgi:hypothetical protein
MRRTLLLVCSCLLGACTPMEWRRGGEVASMDSDEYRNCQAQAYLEANRRMPLFGSFPYPFMGVDRSGRPFLINPPWSVSDRAMQEHWTLTQCMVSRGFDLVPIAPGATTAP